MPLSSSTLSAIQKAGAAIFTADLKLKESVAKYAERVNAAIAANPYNLGNDALFSSWKTIARLSQSLAGIEEEIKKVYQVAAELTGDDQPTLLQVPSLVAPTSTAKKAVASESDLAPTDVLPKTKKAASRAKVKAAPVAKPAKAEKAKTEKVKTAKPQAVKAPKAVKAVKVKEVKVKVVKVKAAPKAKASPSPAKKTVAANPKQELVGNSAKLLRHFETSLNADEFTTVNQTTVGQETGIPIGSMTAATKKLIDTGRIMAGPAGTYKLLNVPAPVVAA